MTVAVKVDGFAHHDDALMSHMMSSSAILPTAAENESNLIRMEKRDKTVVPR